VSSFAGAVNNQGIIENDDSPLILFTGNNNWAGNKITSPATANDGVGTINNTGTLVFGNGGGGIPIGTNGIANNGTQIIFNSSGNVKVFGAVSGTGELADSGPGLLVLEGGNTYTGDTIISNGTVMIDGSLGGNFTALAGSTIAPGAYGIGFSSIGALSIAGNWTNAATIEITINRSLSPSNSTISVTGGSSITPSKVNLLNVGPSLVVGDVYQIFNVGMPGLTVGSTPGFTVTDNLATLGSVTVASVAPAPVELTNSVSGGNVHVTWPAAYTGLHLQIQTNTRAAGYGTNWVTLPGSQLSNTYSSPNGAPSTNGLNGVVFYRLVP